MSLAEVAEVVWPTDGPGWEVTFCGGDVKKVIYCTGEGSNSCGVTVCGGNLFGRVRKDWGLDCFEL